MAMRFHELVKITGTLELQLKQIVMTRDHDDLCIFNKKC